MVKAMLLGLALSVCAGMCSGCSAVKALKPILCASPSGAFIDGAK